MDIEMEFECRECGWVFTRSFLQMEHGRVLKCPFCIGTVLGVRREVAVEESTEPGMVEHSPEGRYLAENKIKL
ncbi:MAG TPA: hypothetical protein DDW94_09465 [Deltaproteobacteria bacterium]|nr:MAG: hypothetical protein A2Z79_03960 [Deltaproteobacteria bacterium GWA2_55_82]OGQ64083.1 MAG: hypothetical protein A3I81_10335 [Deltaproteobacteria bacterium RIFCSPLOWO2_02_FULL_55_12]OIJ74535.1 MAG: hypothetical protein A2V21_309860 [Deltaproteobacteria bacterium GWC2_55_46]HBG47199.1 hypothetical protein [Deltaproteobacteria bacterium]HCY10739.1 hypothetical protein [Deltaproteobacteria bacterium]